jgi:hypothetical protein
VFAKLDNKEIGSRREQYENRHTIIRAFFSLKRNTIHVIRTAANIFPDVEEITRTACSNSLSASTVLKT